MSLLIGIAILALAIFLGGAAALRRDPRRALPVAIRTFAVVAAASVALLHLLPEAIDAVGWLAVIAAAAGAIVPALLERLTHHEATREAPATALAIGYAAVVAHQAGEGAALATLARTGALTVWIVLAIAAHTMPLAMIVAIRVLEARGEKLGPGHTHARAIALALAGIALATILGAFAGSLVEAARLAQYQPWILAVVAGLLLHALAHDAFGSEAESSRARAVDAGAGLAGLVIAALGVERGGWIARVPIMLRVAGVVVLAAAIVARSFRRRRAHHHHAH